MKILEKCKLLEEIAVYSEQANLKLVTINGKEALIREIDLEFKTKYQGKMITNLERMQKGKPPIDPVTGKAYELHHIGQSVDSPLAILTRTEHRGIPNYKILHDSNIEKGVHQQIKGEWGKQTREFWIELSKHYQAL